MGEGRIAGSAETGHLQREALALGGPEELSQVGGSCPYVFSHWLGPFPGSRCEPGKGSCLPDRRSPKGLTAEGGLLCPQMGEKSWVPEGGLQEGL